MSLPPPILYVPILSIALLTFLGGWFLRSRPRLADAAGILFALGFFLLLALAFGTAGIAVLVLGIHKHDWKTVCFSIPFVLIGAAAAAGLIWGGPLLLRNARTKAAHPDEPWLWESDWASGQIPDHAAGGAVGTWIIAGFWNGITIPAVAGAMQQYLRKHDPKLLIVWLFAAVGLWFFVRAIGATMRAAHFGKSVLTLQTLPASPGGALAGTIRVARPLQATGPIKLHLACIRTDRTGDNSMQMTEWEDEQQLDGLPPAGNACDIPVYFTLPADVSPTAKAGGGSRCEIAWRLEVKAPAAEVNYKSQFKIPVFRVANPATVAPPDAALKFRHHDVQPTPADLRGITITRHADGGCAIHFAAARNLSVAFFLTGMSAVLVGFIALVFNVDAPFWVKLIVVGFALGISLLALNAWLATATVTAHPTGLGIYRGLPLLRRQRDLPIDSIKDIIMRITTQMGSTTYYTLQAASEGNPVTIAGGIRGKQNAEYLADVLKRAMGIQPAEPSKAQRSSVTTPIQS